MKVYAGEVAPTEEVWCRVGARLGSLPMNGRNLNDDKFLTERRLEHATDIKHQTSPNCTGLSSESLCAL